MNTATKYAVALSSCAAPLSMVVRSDGRLQFAVAAPRHAHRHEMPSGGFWYATQL
jgi:hypothetical protein